MFGFVKMHSNKMNHVDVIFCEIFCDYLYLGRKNIRFSICFLLFKFTGLATETL